MGYEEDAKELMRRFKMQHEQSMKNIGVDPANKKLNEILNRNENITTHTEDNKDISDIINKSQSNINSFESTEQGPYSGKMSSDMIPADTSESPEQGPYSEQLSKPDSKTQVINFTPQTTPTQSAPVTGNVCSQCKTLHPPLRPGEQCPNKKVDLSDKGMDETSINKFVVDIRNMIVSQMSLKNIQDGKKFFQHTTIELMKILEGYNE